MENSIDPDETPRKRDAALRGVSSGFTLFVNALFCSCIYALPTSPQLRIQATPLTNLIRGSVT